MLFYLRAISYGLHVINMNMVLKKRYTCLAFLVFPDTFVIFTTLSSLFYFGTFHFFSSFSCKRVQGSEKNEDGVLLTISFLVDRCRIEK